MQRFLGGERNGRSQRPVSLVNSLFIPLQNRYKYISIGFSHKQEIFPDMYKRLPKITWF